MEQIKSFVKKIQEDEALRNKLQKLASEGKTLDAILGDVTAIAKENGYEFNEEQCKDYIAQVKKDSQNNVKLSFSDFAKASGDKPSQPLSAACVCEPWTP